MAFDTQTWVAARLIDHAWRRCRANPATQTPELIQAALDAISLVLLSLANRGLNLWKLTHSFISVVPGKASYDLPAGLYRVQAVNYLSNSVATGSVSAITGGFQFDLTDSTYSSRVGFKFSADVTAALTISGSGDGSTFTNTLSIASQAYVAGEWYWVGLPVAEVMMAAQITSATTLAVDDMVVVSQYSTLPMTQFNITDWAQQTNKQQATRPVTNFYFDRLIPSPKLHVWPNASTSATYDFFEVWLHEPITQVNSLTTELDIPTYWLDCICWALAKELSYILPGVTPDVQAAVSGEYMRSLSEAESGESDGATMFLSPNIRTYYRM